MAETKENQEPKQHGYKCKFCPLSFETYNMIMKHSALHMDEMKAKKMNKPRKYKCPYDACIRKSFTCLNDVIEHSIKEHKVPEKRWNIGDTQSTTN